MPTFSDLARAARRRDLASGYPALLDAPPDRLADLPIALDPPACRALDGRDCRGVAHKLSTDPPVPTLVSPGRPPERGVWAPQRVRAVAIALALAWEREAPVERCRVECPAGAVVRSVRLTAGNRRLYRRALRAVRRADRADDPPPRTGDYAKYGSCAYREACRGRTRSLRSRLVSSS